MKHKFIEDIDQSWTLFLDRDGVINSRIFGGYVTCESEFEFIPGVLESINFFSKIFNKIIIITNQQGVGKSIMTESELDSVHLFMKNKISNNGGKIDAIYYCTDLASMPDNCRKPSPNMAFKAVDYFPEINLHKSIMIGDSLSDIEFGENAGMKTVFVTSSEKNEIAINKANIVCENMKDFKKLLEKYNK